MRILFRAFILFISLLLLNVSLAKSELFPDDQDILEIMNKNKVKGTMILSSQNDENTYVYNNKRANLRLSPASTFKIANSIIALEEGVIKDQYEIIKWDGQKRFLVDWNKDQNLKTAFKSSCVWFYQELAKKIGKKKYSKQLEKLGYGNHLIGEDITLFWLKHSGALLRITPFEQINFLKKIYNRQLRISDNTYAILKEIMLNEESETYKIYAKSGAATENWRGHGWYVGYIISKSETWFFATNILINNFDDLPKRITVTMQALKKKGIF